MLVMLVFLTHLKLVSGQQKEEERKKAALGKTGHIITYMQSPSRFFPGNFISREKLVQPWIGRDPLARYLGLLVILVSWGSRWGRGSVQIDAIRTMHYHVYVCSIPWIIYEYPLFIVSIHTAKSWPNSSGCPMMPTEWRDWIQVDTASLESPKTPHKTQWRLGPSWRAQN